MKDTSSTSKPIAYLILAHTDPKQLFELVQSLDYQSRIFIHLDKKSELSVFTRYNYPPSVVFIQDRVRVNWAGFNMITATLNLIKAALNHGGNYSHMVLLSGLDYPIKPVAQIHQFLNSHAEREFIRFLRVEDSPEHYLKIFQRHAFKNPIFPDIGIPLLNRVVTFVDKAIRKVFTLLVRPYKRRPLQGITPCFGSQWWAITPACASYVLDFVDKNPKFVAYFKTAFGPDEYFFHTIIGNSPFLANATGFQKYEGRGTFRMANLHVIHPSLAYVYTHHDFDELQSSDKFFVRKITSSSSGQLIQRIKKEIFFHNEQ